MKFKKIVKKTALILTVIMLLAVGTVFSGYAAVTNLRNITDFTVNQFSSNSFKCTNSVAGKVIDRVNSYPTILGGGYDYSQGKLYMNMVDGSQYKENTYYIQQGNAAPYSVIFEDVSPNTYTHRWVWSRGGGFHAATIDVNLYN